MEQRPQQRRRGAPGARGGSSGRTRLEGGAHRRKHAFGLNGGLRGAGGGLVLDHGVGLHCSLVRLASHGARVGVGWVHAQGVAQVARARPNAAALSNAAEKRQPIAHTQPHAVAAAAAGRKRLAVDADESVGSLKRAKGFDVHG